MSYTRIFNCDNIATSTIVQATYIEHPEYNISDVIKIGDRLSAVNSIDIPVTIYVTYIDDPLGGITFDSDISSYMEVGDEFTITDIDFTTTTTTLQPTTTTTTTREVFSFYKATSTFYPTGSEACSQKSSIPYATLWTTYSAISSGLILYTDSALTSAYVGNGAYIVIRKSDGYDYVAVQVYPSGYISNVFSCSIKYF